MEFFDPLERTKEYALERVRFLAQLAGEALDRPEPFPGAPEYKYQIWPRSNGAVFLAAPRDTDFRNPPVTGIGFEVDDISWARDVPDALQHTRHYAFTYVPGVEARGLLLEHWMTPDEAEKQTTLTTTFKRDENGILYPVINTIRLGLFKGPVDLFQGVDQHKMTAYDDLNLRLLRPVLGRMMLPPPSTD